MSKREVELGPIAFENWRAMLSDAPCNYICEVQLLSDATLDGWATDALGPYSIYGCSASNTSEASHAATLRVQYHSSIREYDPNNIQTDTARYHGGGIVDEVSALMGLLMGVRLRNGGTSRDFFPDGDPLGQPRAERMPALLLLPRREPSGHVIPQALGRRHVSDAVVPLLSKYHELQPPHAVALVRAARLYQDALWLAESQPELAWVLLVSAMEAIATQRQADTTNPVEVLKTANGRLYKTLFTAGGEKLVAKAASDLSRTLAATSRFLEFAMEFLPEAPRRPDAQALPISWTPDDLRRSLSVIYGYRSRALHDGTPFPRPMCHGTLRADGWYNEKPFGSANSTNDATWLAADTPMLLHVFEHICRGTLLNWWRSLLNTLDNGPRV